MVIDLPLIICGAFFLAWGLMGIIRFLEWRREKRSKPTIDERVGGL